MIIDNKVNRVDFHELKPRIIAGHFDIRVVRSGPGFISGEAQREIREVLSHIRRNAKPVVLEVRGEEDLLALPAILEAPLNAVVYYGQPPIPVWSCGPVQSGIVEVVITKEQKKAAQSLLTQFIR